MYPTWSMYVRTCFRPSGCFHGWSIEESSWRLQTACFHPIVRTVCSVPLFVAGRTAHCAKRLYIYAEMPQQRRNHVIIVRWEHRAVISNHIFQSAHPPSTRTKPSWFWVQHSYTSSLEYLNNIYLWRLFVSYLWGSRLQGASFIPWMHSFSCSQRFDFPRNGLFYSFFNFCVRILLRHRVGWPRLSTTRGRGFRCDPLLCSDGARAGGRKLVNPLSLYHDHQTVFSRGLE